MKKLLGAVLLGTALLATSAFAQATSTADDSSASLLLNANIPGYLNVAFHDGSTTIADDTTINLGDVNDGIASTALTNILVNANSATGFTVTLSQQLGSADDDQFRLVRKNGSAFETPGATNSLSYALTITETTTGVTGATAQTVAEDTAISFTATTTSRLFALHISATDPTDVLLQGTYQANLIAEVANI